MADAAPKVSKPFIVIAGIGLLLIVAFLAMKVLGGGGSGDSATSDSTAATAAAGARRLPRPRPRRRPTSRRHPNQSFDVFTTKNPFQPLVTDSATHRRVDDRHHEPARRHLRRWCDPATDHPARSRHRRRGRPSRCSRSANATGTTVARVQVGSTVYTVAVGETFATSYRVVSLDAAQRVRPVPVRRHAVRALRRPTDPEVAAPRRRAPGSGRSLPYTRGDVAPAHRR